MDVHNDQVAPYIYEGQLLLETQNKVIAKHLVGGEIRDGERGGQAWVVIAGDAVKLYAYLLGIDRV